jgi:hypothetical protein
MDAIKGIIKAFLKIRKDLVMLSVACAWLLSNLLEFWVYGQVFWANIFWTAVMWVLILVKNRSDRFNSWLNKGLW